MKVIRARVREDARDVLGVLRLLVVGHAQAEAVRAGCEAARRDREEAAAERRRVRDEPSTTILIDSGYTPAPASVADTSDGLPGGDAAASEPEDGGVTSFTQ